MSLQLAAGAVLPARQREKGLWNFLTWSFFLSHILAAEQFAAAPVRAAESDLDRSSSNDAASEHGNVVTSLAPSDHETLYADDTAAAPATAVQVGLGPLSHVEWGAVAVPFSLDGAMPHGAAGAFSLADAVVDLDQIGVLRGAVSPEGSPPALIELPISLDLPLPILEPGSNLSEILHDVVAPAIAPLIATVDGILDTAELVTQPLTALTGEIAGSLAGEVEAIIAPLSGVVDTLAQPLGGVVEIVDALANEVNTSLVPLSPVVDTLVHPLDDLVATEAAQSALQALDTDSVVGCVESMVQALPSVDVHAVVASGGLLTLPELPGAMPAAVDDLFSSQGGYSDYNLALHSLPAGDAGTVTRLEIAVGDPSAIADHVLHSPQAAVSPETHALGSSLALPSTLEELHLRGLGDGIV
jgi:hypothetical protein